jgi:hypothetical protein
LFVAREGVELMPLCGGLSDRKLDWVEDALSRSKQDRAGGTTQVQDSGWLFDRTEEEGQMEKQGASYLQDAALLKKTNSSIASIIAIRSPIH